MQTKGRPKGCPPCRVTLGLEQNRFAMLLAVMSSFRNRRLPADLIVFGEAGLW